MSTVVCQKYQDVLLHPVIFCSMWASMLFWLFWLLQHRWHSPQPHPPLPLVGLWGIPRPDIIPPADLSLPRSPPSDVDTNTLRCSGVTTISTGSFECESVCLFWSPRLAPKSVPKMSHTHPKFKAGQCVILIMLTYWYKSVLNTFLHRSKSWCSHRKVWIHLSNTFLYAHGIQKIAYKCSCCFKHMTRYTAQGKIHSDR